MPVLSEQGYYGLYTNFPSHTSLVVNHREGGLHFTERRGPANQPVKRFIKRYITMRDQTKNRKGGKMKKKEEDEEEEEEEEDEDEFDSDLTPPRTGTSDTNPHEVVSFVPPSSLPLYDFHFRRILPSAKSLGLQHSDERHQSDDACTGGETTTVAGVVLVFV
jgi:hypothetical protein